MFWSLQNRESIKNIRRVHKRLSNIRKKIMSSLDRSNIDVTVKTIIILKFNNYLLQI
jgi:flagellar motor switch protein FliM